MTQSGPEVKLSGSFTEKWASSQMDQQPDFWSIRLLVHFQFSVEIDKPVRLADT